MFLVQYVVVLRGAWGGNKMETTSNNKCGFCIRIFVATGIAKAISAD